MKGEILFRGPPLLVASIPVEGLHDLMTIHRISDIDFIELRVDYLDNPLVVDYSSLPKNIIITLRDVAEGGVRHHSSAIKLKLIEVLNNLGLLYDIELSFVKKYNVKHEGKIVSIHIMDPSNVDLKAVKRDVELYMDKAFMIKVATKPFPGYRIFLMDLLELGDNIAVMPMETSCIERIAFALLGSKLLYCYINRPTALGQPKCSKVKYILKLLTDIR